MLSEHDNVECFFYLALYFIFRNIFKFTDELQVLSNGEHLIEYIELLAKTETLTHSIYVCHQVISINYTKLKIVLLLRAFPLVGLRIPVIMLSTVVFPAPLCPNKQKTSFSLMERVRESTALKEPNFFVRFCSWIGSYYSSS